MFFSSASLQLVLGQVGIVFKSKSLKFSSVRMSFDEQTPGVQVAKVTNTFVRTGEKNIGKLRVTDGPNENVCLGEYWHGNWICCKKRMVGEIQCQGVEPDYGINVYLWFTSVTLRTKHQRRYSGTTWWTTNTPNLYLSGSGTLVFANTSFPNWNFSVPPNYAAQDDGWLEYAVDVNSLGIPCLPGNTVCPGQFKVTQTSGYHTAVCNDWVSRSCSTWFDRPF
jgi:hypothetical protein